MRLEEKGLLIHSYNLPYSTPLTVQEYPFGTIVPLLSTQQLQPSRNFLEIQDECKDEKEYSQVLSEHVEGSNLMVSIGRTP